MDGNWIDVRIRHPQGKMMPRRRVSIAVVRAEPNSYMETPCDGGKRQLRDPVRVKRYSKLFDSSSTPTQAVEAATPMSVNRTSSRFMGSPMGSWKPKLPTVIALQKKAVQWSPLRMKATLRQRQSSIFP